MAMITLLEQPLAEIELSDTDKPTQRLNIEDLDHLFRQHYSHLVRFVQRYVRNIDADESMIDDMVDMSGDPADLIENQQMAERVEKMLSALPERILETFEAVLEHESSYAVAAEKMHIPIGTVRSRVSRVREQIRLIIN
jgi:DNA-directed RNA polymerase specialized sigma24 family protein